MGGRIALTAWVPHSRRAPLLLAAGVLRTASSAIFVKFAHMPGPVSAFYRVLFGWLGAFVFLRERQVVLGGIAMVHRAVGRGRG